MTPVSLDSESAAFFLKIPREGVVVLQGIFETYEGVGTVRTLRSHGEEASIVSVLTTASMASVCGQILEDVKLVVPWEEVIPPEELLNVVLGGKFQTLAKA